jgi:hypothetical protein
VEVVATSSPAPLNLTPEALRNVQCQKWMQERSFSFHPRVKRWWTDDLTKIQQFIDFDSMGKPIQKYLNYTPEALKKMKAYHDLPGVYKFLNPIYSFPTDTGFGMMCVVKREGLSDAFGVLYFGIDNGKIYHQFFEECDPAFMQSLDVFKGAFVPKCEAGSPENSESETVGTYSATVSVEGVVTITCPERESSMQIFPIRPESLPTPPFLI